MKTAYILTDGCYSDYHIVGVYSTLELAEKAKEHLSGDDVYIEEYDIDTMLPTSPPGMFAWHIVINYDTSEITNTYKVDCLGSNFDPNELYSEGNSKYSMPATYHVQCWARDEEHAQKIALDKYYQYKAEKMFV